MQHSPPPPKDGDQLTSDSLQAAFDKTLNTVNDLKALEDLRLAFLGKKGALTMALKALGALPLAEKKAQGAALNKVRNHITTTLEEKKGALEEAQLAHRLAQEFEDLSLPTLATEAGCVHPVTQVMDELVTIFADLSFSAEEGPEVETDFNNFTALNIHQAHPARQSHDTFYLDKEESPGLPYLLRTHTSTVQIRTMLREKKPLRIITMGRVYRSDYDATHTPMFHQLEGLVLGPAITLAHMKWTLERFLCAFFNVSHVNMRLRPSYFPFTEPGAEVDVACTRKKDKLILGTGADWLEILGCGMVHPNVLKSCGLDPEQIQGFAFGCGIDRLAMLKYGIPDLRTFFETDQRWLKHYGFGFLDVPSPVLGGK